MTRILKNNKMIAAVAVLAALICIVPMSAVDGASNTGQTYDMDMRVGDSFSYNVQTNLSSIITASGDAVSGESGFLTFTDNLLSGTPTRAGSTSVTLTAKWTSPDNSALTQTATQTINFTVFERIAITDGNTQNISVLVGAAADAEIYNIAGCYTGPAGTVVSSVVFKNSSGEATDAFRWNTETGKILLSSAITAEDIGSYSATVVLTHAQSTDQQTLTLSIGIFADLSLTSSTQLYTYVGNNLTYAIVTNHDGSGAIVKSADLSGLSGISNLALSNGTVSGSFTGAALTGSVQYKDYTFTVSASGSLNGTALTSITETVNVRVYASLAFTSTPSMEGITAHSSSGSNTDVLVSASVTGATKITYAWGDGTTTLIDNTSPSSATYSARHVYASEGFYQISITAANDVGDVRSIVSYDADSGSWTADAGAADTGFFDDHGFAFLILIVLGLLLIVAYFFGAGHPVVPIIGIAAIVLGAVLLMSGMSLSEVWSYITGLV